ncbi:MAG: diacylglycerol kinase family protein [Devosia sp.]
MSVGIVVNPTADGGRLNEAWPELKRLLEARLGPLDVLHTTVPGDGRRLAAQHVRNGRSLIIAAGGDGTANEVADGLLKAGGGPALGLISMGTGRDFIRTLGYRADMLDAVDAISLGRTRLIDAGRVSYVDDDGHEQMRHFLNVGSLGVSGPTVRAVNASRHARRTNGRIAFYYHTIVEMLKYRPQRVRLRFDDGESLEVETALVAVANGRFFGGGMMVAPDAALDDGLFDVLIYRADGKLRMVLDFNTIYRGAHVKLPRVRVKRCRWVEVEPVGGESDAAIMEIDGESPGRIPARFELLPRALTLRA